jgi:hypothetical protein
LETKHTGTAGNGGSTTSHDSSKSAAPIVIDLGSAKKSQIKSLEKGEGPLLDKVFSVLDELRSDGTINGTSQPVIVVVKKKVTKTGLLASLL